MASAGLLDVMFLGGRAALPPKVCTYFCISSLGRRESALTQFMMQQTIGLGVERAGYFPPPPSQTALESGFLGSYSSPPKHSYGLGPVE